MPAGSIYLGSDVRLRVEEDGRIFGATGRRPMDEVGHLRWSDAEGAYEAVIGDVVVSLIDSVAEGGTGWRNDGDTAERVKAALARS